MSSVAQQKDVVVTLKKESLLNVRILSKLHPMPSELSRLLKDNNLEKPTQNLFYHLAYYLVSIIDPHLTLPWPLYDSKTERTYRNELSQFITTYGEEGLLSPVMSSYLVNPGCYKVINLMLQMSQLAVERVLLAKINKESQKMLYNEITEKYKSFKKEGFMENVERETSVMRSKFSNYLAKRDAIEKIAKQLRDQINKNENTLKLCNAQEYIDNLVDGYIKTHTLDNATKQEILEIKDIHKPSKYFDKWLNEVDNQITQMESDWESKTAPFMKICQTTLQNTETLIARQTGEADKRTFMIEYNPKVDTVNTEELEKLVNTQQKYILKNIVDDGKLNFPNLIRGFLISICFVLQNAEIGDEIFKFNEYLEEGKKSYTNVVNAMKVIMDRLMNAEGKLRQPQEISNSTISVRDLSEIPPLPDLSDLKMNKEFQQLNHHTIDTFTPINFTKHQFNLNKRRTGSFLKPIPKVFVTSFPILPKDEFFKSLISCRVSNYDNMNLTQNAVNLSVMSHTRSNETIAECTSGFTKQQICRLLSTKKSSSTKKFKRMTERSDMKIKRGGLFNESSFSNESIGVFRSHSSPNLYENRDKRFHNNLRSRKLSIMKEDCPSVLEMSGIAVLERDSNHSTPQGMISLETSRKLMDAASLPSILTPQSDISDNLVVDLNKEIKFKAPQMLPIRKSREIEEKAVSYQRKSKLPQPTSKKVSENQKIVPQRKSKDSFEEQTALLQGKTNETLEEKFVLPQRKSEEASNKHTPQRKIKELFEEPAIFTQRKSVEFSKEESKDNTPKTNPYIVKKTSSLEKIINRFKKVRASLLPSEPSVENKDFNTIFEEKENLKSANVNEVLTANKNLLPDLLSPSCSMITKSTDYVLDELYFDNDDDDDKPRKARESLGTALGVDHTFLDQFDLID